MSARGDEPGAIEAAAAGWLARRDRGFTPEEVEDFAQWCAADSRHQSAVEELAMVWGALDDLSASMSQQRAGGVVAASPARKAPLPSSVPAAAERRRERPALARWWPGLSLAAALAIAAGVSLWNRPDASVESTARYETVVGAQKKISLPDGSQLQLNTNTAVSLRFEAKARRLTLERGEAFFQVAKEAARPFVVSAGGTEVRVLGTTFVVRLRDDRSDVLVTEGQVQFGASGAAGLKLGARQHAVLAKGASGLPRVETLDPDEVVRRLSWQSGRLEFKDTPLREVVAEFNRYHRQRIVLRDAATEAVSVGGTFDVENLDGFVRLLDMSFGVMVVGLDADKILLGLGP